MRPRLLIIGLLLAFCLAASACGDKPVRPVDAFFVRGGLVVENVGELAGELAHRGRPVADWRAGQSGRDLIRLPQDRLLVLFPWRPGQIYSLTVGGRTRSLEAPQRPSPLLVTAVDLEDIKPHGGQMGHAPDTEVRFSPDGGRLAIGTYRGRLEMVDIPSGRRIWDRKLAEGMVKRLAWGSIDGRRVLYVGEQSPEGLIYCLDAADGQEIWRFETWRFVGRGKASADRKNAVYNLPGIYYLRVLPDGSVLTVATYGRFEGENYTHDGLVCRLDGADGRLVWRWPEETTFPYGITWVGASAKGGTLALISFNIFGPRVAGPFREGTLYCLNGDNGCKRWHYRVPPLKPHYNRVGSWQSVAVSPDGQRVLLGLNDGRAMLFDGRDGGTGPLWTLPVGQPVMIGDMPVAAPVSYARLARGAVYLATPGTTIPAGARAGRRTPQPHPHARQFFAYDLEGRLRWQHRTEGSAQGITISDDGRWVATCVGASRASDDRDRFGLTLFDTRPPDEGQTLVYHFATDGPAFFQTDISPGGRYLALTESAYTRDEGKTVHGSYRVLVIH